MARQPHFDLQSIRGDIFGGITAAVVALPLALAFGVASGAGAIAGLYGAIATGFFAALFGGTRAQISGPTGPMTIVMAAVVATHTNNLGEAFTIVFLGGAFQILFGILRLGRYVVYTPYSVLSGFMSGIGIIIIVIQTMPLLGLEIAPGGPIGTVQAWPKVLGTIDGDAMALGGIALLIMIFWPKRLRPVLPPPLAALIICTMLAILVFDQAPVIGSVPTGLPDLWLPDLNPGNLPAIIQPALILALLGSIDSLLTSLVADSITRSRHDSNRELIGQGVGNMVAGLIGGLPGAGATMRTVVNVRAGGRTPISGALHAVILLALVLGLSSFAEAIPHAVLAGILIKVGWDIIDWGYLKRVHRAPRDKVYVMLVTLALTVFVDLITAVAVGLILAGFVTAQWMATEELKGVTAIEEPEDGDGLTPEENLALSKAKGRIGVVRLRGRFSYASARELVQLAGAVTTKHEAIIFDFTEAARLDTSAALAIEELFSLAACEAKRFYVSGITGHVEETLEALRVLDKVPTGNIFEDRFAAITRAAQAIENDGNGT